MITLIALSRADAFPFYNWINDKKVIKYSLSIFDKINMEKEEEKVSKIKGVGFWKSTI